MFKVLIPAVAALGLVAFTAQSRDAASVGEPGMETAVMGWSVHHEGEMAKLAYGVANSDHLAVMVTCMPGRPLAEVYGDVRIEGAQVIQASLTIDPLSGGDAEDMQIPLTDPALTGLAQRGYMTVLGDAGSFRLQATTQERRLVRDFLAYCSTSRV